MSFYDRYAELCAKNKIDPCSQKAADMFGVTRATISTWKKNKSTPKGETVAAIADKLNTSADYLLGRKSNSGTAQADTAAPSISEMDQAEIGMPSISETAQTEIDAPSISRMVQVDIGMPSISKATQIEKSTPSVSEMVRRKHSRFGASKETQTTKPRLFTKTDSVGLGISTSNYMSYYDTHGKSKWQENTEGRRSETIASQLGGQIPYISGDMLRLLRLYDRLDSTDKIKVEAYIEGVLSADKYKK